MSLSNTLKAVLVSAVLIPIGIWLSLTMFGDLYNDTNTAVTNLNETYHCDGVNCTAGETSGYGTSGNFLITSWKIAQYGFVILVLAAFGLAVIMKSLGKI